ncbi:MAG: uridine kinase [Faecalibacterium sp.]|nr:uridine kinase [Faecalibacterium sp.]
MNNLIIGIAGGSGSGKTTLAYRLKERFGEDEVRLISHDSYYKRHDELPFAERCKLNYDHPDAFDNDLLIQHLKELKAGRAIDCPVYDYANHNRSSEVQHIEPAPVLIVEGILPLAEPELCSLFDYKIYVDTDADERILRRILRDVKERGRSLDSVIAQYRATVKPMNEIRELSWSQMVVPVAAISMKDGECYKFIIYNKSGFEKAYKQYSNHQE